MAEEIHTLGVPRTGHCHHPQNVVATQAFVKNWAVSGLKHPGRHRAPFTLWPEVTRVFSSTCLNLNLGSSKGQLPIRMLRCGEVAWPPRSGCAQGCLLSWHPRGLLTGEAQRVLRLTLTHRGLGHISALGR